MYIATSSSVLEGILAKASENINESREGTIFYRRRISDWIRRYIIELVIIFLVVAFAITTTIITVGARKAFREAKDVRTALMFVGTHYYGTGSCIYDPSKPTGLIDGADQEIEDVSTRHGQVYLYAWDDKNNEPLMFEYKKGLYTVSYVADSYVDKASEDGKVYRMMGTWNVTYSIRILNYESE